MHFSNSICHNSCAPAHLIHFQPDATSSSDKSSAGLQNYSDIKKTHPEDDSCSGRPAGSSTMCFSQLKFTSPREGTAGHLSEDLRPIPTSNAHYEWDLNRGHQAKRVRVETIIKGMTNCPDMVTDQQEIRSDQEPSLHQIPIERSVDYKSQETRKYLERRLKYLRQLRTKFPHTAGGSKEDNYPPQSDVLTDSQDDFKADSRQDQIWSKMKLENYFQSKPERVKLMADALKYELSQAVSRSVDSIFKCASFLQTLPNHVKSTETRVASQFRPHKQRETEVMQTDAASVQIADVQTEALSLVLPKPDMNRWNDHHQESVSLSPDVVLHEDQVSERLDLTKGPYMGKIRSKVNSRSVRNSKTPRILDAMLLESLDFSHVKIKADRLATNNIYMLNEGLTTNHLKKAKLMFFYTRYPSSLVLKLCFDDVQFTRCITSQLIKWFSNFREFYYIQMEKFARQVVRGDVRTLTVGRESELFRVLNMHYNKANDFQVPDRFLEVAEITLREFYVSISTGKDRDPSWKKAIYKVICKLDSDVPSEFKSHSGEEPSKIC
ncbi:prospero homeobox protein 1-like [Gouania willdenowi]|uniref:prospero homeobox protein 1-like n=1 Tax=Gouania willdenowi TaxID=441366 RepID=UPI00105627AD|nr:prospero homeobox protein 1-like [Gouania willdenowi]